MTKLIVDFARVFERQSQGCQQGGFQQSQQGYPQPGQQNYPQQGQGDPWASSQGQQQWGGPNDGPPFLPTPPSEPPSWGLSSFPGPHSFWVRPRRA